MDRLDWYVVSVIGVLCLIGTMLVMGGDAIGNMIYSPDIQKCIDTDGGINLFEKGQVTSADWIGEDYCMTEDGEPIDVCRGRQCYITEQFCRHPVNVAEGFGLATVKQCPPTATVCLRGACVEPTKVDLPYEIRKTN